MDKANDKKKNRNTISRDATLTITTKDLKGKVLKVTDFKIVLIEDLKGKVLNVVFPFLKEAEPKVKVSSHFLNSYFTTDDTLKNYQGQLQFDFKAEGDITDITDAKNTLAVIVSKGFKGLNLSYQEDRVIKGIFNLLNKQNANEERPFIVLDSISRLYEEILEKKVTKKKGKYSFADFSGAEIKEINEAIENLKKNMQQVIIKGYDGTDKKTKKPLYFFYMQETPLIKVEYLKREIPLEEVKEMTEKQLKETGEIKISILPIFLRDYHKYYKLLPKDISKEVREKCPDVKRVNKPLVDFINLLHRQDRDALIKGNELRRKRETLIKELRLEIMYKKNKKRTVDRLLSCYDIAKRTGYLEDYKIDQKGKYELVDIFYLNILRFEHLTPKQIKIDTELEKGLIDVYKE
jgi:hypothetical protein